MKKSLAIGIVFYTLSPLWAGIIIAPSELTNWGPASANPPIVTEQKLTAQSEERKIQLKVKDLDSFEAEENQLLTFTVQIPDKMRSVFHLYWGTSTEPALHESRSVHQIMIGNSTPLTYTVFLAGHSKWNGTITTLRIDPAEAPKGSPFEFNLGDIRFDSAQNGFPIHAASWLTPVNLVNCRIENNTVIGDFTGRSAHIYAPLPLPFPAQQFKTLSFELRLPVGAYPLGKVYWRKGKEQYNETHSALYQAIADGEFHKITVDLFQNPEWKDDITGLRLDFAVGKPSASGTIAFRNVRLQ